MSLRNKTLLVTGATLVGLMIVLYAASRVILLDGFIRLEEQNTRETIQLVPEVLHDQVAQLTSVVADWAPWDDTYKFIEDGDAAYIESNLVDNTFINLELNLIVFVNSSGQIMFGTGFDLQNKRPIALPAGLQEYLADPRSGALLLRHPDPQSSLSGIVFLPGISDPVLIASQPIVKSDGTGPMRGALIMGRYLDSAGIEKLTRLTRRPFSVYRYGDARLPVSDKTPLWVQPLSDQIIAGYALIQDVYGQPALVLGIELPRSTFQQGQASLRYLLGSLLIAGVVFIVMTLLIWDQLALSRLARLSADVSRIGTTGDLSTRAVVAGHDELSSVASAINRMLEALQHSEQQLRQMASELQALYETSLSLNAPLERPDLLRRVVEQAVKLLGAKAGRLYQRGDLAASISVGNWDGPADQIKLDDGPVGQAFAQHHTLMVQVDPRQTVLAVPLVGRDGVLGVLSLASSECAFDDHDVKLADLFAVQVAVALEKTQLHDEVQRRVRELDALNNASQALLSTLDLQAVLELVIADVKSLLSAEEASVLLQDQATLGLVFTAVASPNSERLVNVHISAATGIAGWVMQEKQSVLVHDAYRDPRFFKQVDEITGLTTRSLVAVPLMSKGTVNGVIEAINKTGGPFEQHDLEILEAMAGPAALALENARLYGETRKTASHLKALSRRLVEVQEAERSRIARELHDEMGQALTSQMVHLRLLAQDADRPEAVLARVAELKQMTVSVLENMHRLAVDLRPASLDHLGLVTALRQYVDAFGRQYGITLQFETVRLDDERLPPEMETALYRIVQEALTNVARHALASRADVILERRGEQMILLIWDNGVGFDPEAVAQRDRTGLVGMRERAEMLGGTLAIESEAGMGTTLVVEIPCVHQDSDRG